MQKKIYIVGIGGAGTSVLARLYVAQGYSVSGSDDGDGFYTDALRAEGIEVTQGFSATHIPAKIDFAVHSTAFGDDNEEIAELKARGITLVSYPEALGRLTQERYTIAVCGTHGKTTTTALTTHALIGAGRDPQALVGSHVVGWTGGARIGSGKEFVIEADEYQNKLAQYYPQAVILTSIDFDHPDFFADFAAYKKVFSDFCRRVPRHGVIVACHDDNDAMEAVHNLGCTVLTYGQHVDADARMRERVEDSYGQRITVTFHEKDYTITTKLLGLHNALNAVAAWTLSTYLSKDAAGSSKGIADFHGTARRAERKGVYKGAVMIDDYAHHPTEIRATLTALREVYPHKKLIAAFHPHTFSRTKALLDDFAYALTMADAVVVLDIYSSAREEQGDVTSNDLVHAINANDAGKAQYMPLIADLATWAQTYLTDNDVFVTLGAGDIWTVHDSIMNTKKHL